MTYGHRQKAPVGIQKRNEECGPDGLHCKRLDRCRDYLRKLEIGRFPVAGVGLTLKFDREKKPISAARFSGSQKEIIRIHGPVHPMRRMTFRV
jgi:hypothetical protein